MSGEEIYRHFINELQHTSALEFFAALTGIISVWFSKKENIWVYPIGLFNTVAYVYISIKGQLFGEASVNIFYTIMGIYGWVLWSKKDADNRLLVLVKYSTRNEWAWYLLFFFIFYISIYLALSYLQDKNIAPGAIPAADAFAAAAAYTGMLLMARKKVESWLCWIATNAVSIPLYFIKGYVFSSFQFLILLIMAFIGLSTWHKKALNAGN